MTTSVDFGTDLSLRDDLDPAFRLVSGTTLLGEAVYRRLTTPRGMLLDDQDYGLDVKGFLHKGLTTSARNAIPGQIRGEILKDERIDSADVTIAWPSQLEMVITIRCSTAEGPFKLVFAVTAETVFPPEILAEAA